jgi:hypothetical protein
MSRSTCVTPHRFQLLLTFAAILPWMHLPPLRWRRWVLRPLLRAWAVLACEVPLGDA